MSRLRIDAETVIAARSPVEPRRRFRGSSTGGTRPVRRNDVVMMRTCFVFQPGVLASRAGRTVIAAIAEFAECRKAGQQVIAAFFQASNG